jgi:hypothetical protein
MSVTDDNITLHKIVLELAREPGHPSGDRDEKYVIVAPLTDDGHIDAEAWKQVRERCRVARESSDDETSLGHLVHGPGGRWFLHYDISNDREDESGFRFEDERFVPGEYISVERDDGTHVFRVVVSMPVGR